MTFMVIINPVIMNIDYAMLVSFQSDHGATQDESSIVGFLLPVQSGTISSLSFTVVRDGV